MSKKVTFFTLFFKKTFFSRQKISPVRRIHKNKVLENWSMGKQVDFGWKKRLSDPVLNTCQRGQNTFWFFCIENILRGYWFKKICSFSPNIVKNVQFYQLFLVQMHIWGAEQRNKKTKNQIRKVSERLWAEKVVILDGNKGYPARTNRGILHLLVI